MDSLIHVRPKVPIIGGEARKVKCFAFDARATILCDCGNMDPIDIPSFTRAGYCKSCKTKYVISVLTFNNVGGHITTNITVAKWHGPDSATRDLEVPGLLT